MRSAYSLNDFWNQFPDDDACLEYLFKKDVRYGEVCPSCKEKTQYYRVKDRKCYECGSCGHQIYPMSKTIFKRSSTSLRNWFMAIYIMGNSKNGVSAKEIERTLGISYPTAWSMCHKIRAIMNKDDEGMLTGIVEIDESQIGGKKNKNKFYVVGMVERSETGRIKTKIVRDRPNAEELIPIIKKNVSKEAVIYTDKYGAYHSLSEKGYKHKSISHKASYSYRNGVSTNCIEGFWALFKKSILGTHKKVSKKWLQHYLNEFSFRYSRRQEVSIFFELLDQTYT